jgi:hypothetical protein
VDHLHVVARANFTNVEGARLAVDLGSALGNDGFHHVVGSLGATGHEGRALTSAFLAAGNAHTHEHDVLGLEFLSTADGVGVPLIATIDDKVARLHELGESSDGRVHRLASHDEKDDLAGLLEGQNKFLIVLVALEGEVALGLSTLNAGVDLCKKPSDSYGERKRIKKKKGKLD